MAGPIRIAILANASQARREINSTGDAATGLGSKITSAGKRLGAGLAVGAAVAGAAALKLGADCVKSASNAQQSLGATETVFGRYAGSVISNSKKAAKEVGLSANEYRELANVMGASLNGAGIPLKKTASLTSDINKRAADMAATFGGTTRNAVEAIGSLMRGEADPIEAYGVSIKQADVSARLAAQGQDKLTGAALKQAEMQARLDLLMQKTTKTQGAFKRESGTLAHQQQVLGAQFENIKAKIGTALLPVLTTLLTILNNNIGPAFRSVAGFVAPLVARVQEFFASATGGTSALAPLMSVLQTVSATITGTVIPAVVAVAGYFASRLAPILQQVAAIVTGKVLPIVASLARFFTGTLVPAVVAIATRVGANLRPILDQLFATVQGKVLPAVARLLDKFREWQPTIQRVIAIVTKVVGKVLEFASAILGKVLPPVIRFAGFLTGTLLAAIGGAISIVVKIIAKVIEFGGALITGAKKVGDFASKVGTKVGEVVTFFTNLPGKIKGALSGAGTMLTDIGRNIVEGLGRGIDAAKQWLIDKVKALGDLIPGWLKRRLGIASPSKVTTYLGRMAGIGLANGLRATGGAVAASAVGLAKAVVKAAQVAVDATQKAIDQIQSKIDSASGIRDAITGLRDSIAGALTGDLFGGIGDEAGTALDKFRATLNKAKTTADEVRTATQTLLGKGVSGSFLESLTASGNTELIVELSQSSDAAALAAQYEQILATNAESGQLVAEEVVGVRLDTVNANLTALAEQMASEQANLIANQLALSAAERAERQAERERDREERRKEKEKEREERREEREKDRQRGQRLNVSLSSQEVDQLSRGRGYKADIRAYEEAGGR